MRTGGVLFGARNPHGSTTTVNGVTFEAMAGNTVGDFALSSPGNILGANGPFGSTLMPFADLSGEYKDLLGSGKFTHTPPNSPPPITLTISGLSIGQLYEFQWWVHDARDLGDLDRTTTATAGDSVALEHIVGIEGDVGQFVVGSFSADATTQAIEFQGFGAGTNFGSTQLNAFQLRAVPAAGCPAAAAVSCVSMARASLSVQEKKAGRRSSPRSSRASGAPRSRATSATPQPAPPATTSASTTRRARSP